MVWHFDLPIQHGSDRACADFGHWFAAMPAHHDHHHQAATAVAAASGHFGGGSMPAASAALAAASHPHHDSITSFLDTAPPGLGSADAGVGTHGVYSEQWMADRRTQLQVALGVSTASFVGTFSWLGAQVVKLAKAKLAAEEDLERLRQSEEAAAAATAAGEDGEEGTSPGPSRPLMARVHVPPALAAASEGHQQQQQQQQKQKEKEEQEEQDEVHSLHEARLTQHEADHGAGLLRPARTRCPPSEASTMSCTERDGEDLESTQSLASSFLPTKNLGKSEKSGLAASPSIGPGSYF